MITRVEHVTKHEEKMLKFYGACRRSRIWKLFKGGLSLQVYKVVVNQGPNSWFIFRRYNEFHTLFEKVRYFFVLLVSNFMCYISSTFYCTILKSYGTYNLPVWFWLMHMHCLNCFYVFLNINGCNSNEYSSKTLQIMYFFRLLNCPKHSPKIGYCVKFLRFPSSYLKWLI